MSKISLFTAISLAILLTFATAADTNTATPSPVEKQVSQLSQSVYIVINGVKILAEDYKTRAETAGNTQKIDMFSKIHKLQKTIAKNFYNFKKNSAKVKDRVVKIDYERPLDPTEYLRKVHRILEHGVSDWTWTGSGYFKQKEKIYPPNWNCMEKGDTRKCMESGMYKWNEPLPEDLRVRPKYSIIKKKSMEERRLRQLKTVKMVREQTGKVKRAKFVDMPNQRVLEDTGVERELAKKAPVKNQPNKAVGKAANIPGAKPAAQKPQVKPPVNTPVKTRAKPVAKPAVKAAVKPPPKPATKPTGKPPAVNSAQKPSVKPTTKTPVKTATKPFTKPAVKPVVKPVAAATAPTAKTASPVATKPISKPDLQKNQIPQKKITQPTPIAPTVQIAAPQPKITSNSINSPSIQIAAPQPKIQPPKQTADSPLNIAPQPVIQQTIAPQQPPSKQQQPAVKVAEENVSKTPKEQQQPKPIVSSQTPVTESPASQQAANSKPPEEPKKEEKPLPQQSAVETKEIKSDSQTSNSPPPETSAVIQPQTEIPKGDQSAPGKTAPPTSTKDQQITAAMFKDSHPIRIAYDLSLVKGTLIGLYNVKSVSGEEKARLVKERSQVWNGLKNLISKADSFIRRFVLVSNEFLAKDLVFSKPICSSHPQKFNKKSVFDFVGGKLKISADLVVFVDIYSDKSDPTLAEAKSCQKSSDSGLQILGQMSINIANFVFPETRIFKEIEQFMTIVHETFHIIGFNPDSKSNVRHADVENQLTYLKSLTEENRVPLIDNLHFKTEFLPLDLMVPIARVDADITVFSLEYIDNISPYIITNKQYLNSLMTEDIADFKKFFNYKCTDQPKSIYHYFCSAAQKQNKPYSCSENYLFKMKCSDILPNGCYLNKPLSSSSCIENYDNSIYGVSRSMGYEGFETTGENSRCFENADNDKSYCLMYKIQETPAMITVRAEKQDYVCLKEGQVHEIKSYSGQVLGRFVCPDPNKFILNQKKSYCPNMCHGNGSCLNGKCECYDGYDPKTNCKEFAEVGGGATVFIESMPIVPS